MHGLLVATGCIGARSCNSSFDCFALLVRTFALCLSKMPRCCCMSFFVFASLVMVSCNVLPMPGSQCTEVAAALSVHRHRSRSACVISSAWRSVWWSAWGSEPCMVIASACCILLRPKICTQADYADCELGFWKDKPIMNKQDCPSMMYLTVTNDEQTNKGSSKRMIKNK